MNSEENMNGGMAMASSEVDPFYGSNWDSIISLNQSGTLGKSSYISQNEFNDPHYLAVLHNQILARSSHLVNFPSDSNLVVDLVPNVPSFGSGCFSEMDNSFSSFAQNGGVITQRASRNVAISLDHSQSLENRVLGDSFNGRRKRKVSSGASFKNAEDQHGKDPLEDTESLEEHDEMNQNIDQNCSTNLRGKQVVDRAKNNAVGAEPSKENYLHMRAKRGQATSSHSLAERVRRERISERMKLLQELVPGCNKITGKAVMLDEIINYVQSLQHQVEFLSMKLATVNPELNVDIEQILSKSILNSRGGNARAREIDPGVSPSHTFQGFSHGNFHGLLGTIQPFHPLPHNLYDNELRSILQTGSGSNPPGQKEM